VGAFPRTVARVEAEDIAEALPRRVALAAVGMPPAEVVLAEEAPARPLAGRFDQLRIWRRNAIPLPVDPHNCCRIS
jgi:hypothetical protein